MQSPWEDELKERQFVLGVQTHVSEIVKKNPHKIATETLVTIENIFGNIVKKPQDDKKRKLRTSNDLVQKLFAVRGAEMCVYSAGFCLKTEGHQEYCVLLPQEGSMERLKKALAVVQKQLKSTENKREKQRSQKQKEKDEIQRRKDLVAIQFMEDREQTSRRQQTTE